MIYSKFHLQAANHPLLLRSIFDDQKLSQVADVLIEKPCEWHGEKKELVLEELERMSDWKLSNLCFELGEFFFVLILPHVIEFEELRPFVIPHKELSRLSTKFEALSRYVSLSKILSHDRLLPALQKEGRRVLIFSQMTKLLDILEVLLHCFNLLLKPRFFSLVLLGCDSFVSMAKLTLMVVRNL